MKVTAFHSQQWLAIVMMVLSGLIVLFTPYPHTGMAMAIPGLIWMASLVKHTPNFIAIATKISLATSCVFFMGNRATSLGPEEYLALILILPYMVMTVARLNGVKPTRNKIILFGITAGMSLLLNPSFLAIPIFFELIALSRSNNRWLMAIILATIALPGLFLQFTTYLHRDMAWILHSTKRLMEGGVFGQDVIDCNPPLMWYLSYPIVFLSEATGWHPANMFRITVALVTILVLLWMASIRRTSSMTCTRWGANTLLMATVYVFFVTSNMDMGQREYLALLFSLPYITMAATRLSGLSPTQSEALLVGIMAGIGIALKPYFLAVPFAVELVVWIIARRFSYFWRPEVVSGMVTMIAYGFVVLIFAPAYIFEIVPLVQKSYWASDLSYLSLFRSGSQSLMALTIAAFLCRRLSTTPMAYILIAAGFGFTLSYFVQKKGVNYHEFPIRALAIMALIALVVEGVQRSQTLGWRNIRGATLLALTILTFLLASDIQHVKEQYHSKKRLQTIEGSRGWLQGQLIETLNKYGPEKTFFAISTNMFPGSPTVLYTHPKWAGVDIVRRHMPAITKTTCQRTHGGYKLCTCRT